MLKAFKSLWLIFQAGDVLFSLFDLAISTLRPGRLSILNGSHSLAAEILPASRGKGQEFSVFRITKHERDFTC
ncbi:hypothetical protein BKA59DRAFT_462749 [Fusarium tricinctum]|uniref:Uncharacterized protein n=1 Tax=Fusarium tricinctum TaxID=61284 RepID=A0A8K0S479_9HYPO|nr:hypothetical protein BKA59DRAFT_462749 [Fusarium tricinctum]